MDKVHQDSPDDGMDEFYETNEAGDRGRYHWEGRNLVFVPAEQDSEVPISSAEEEEVEISVPVVSGEMRGDTSGVGGAEQVEVELERELDTYDWEYWREIEKSGGAPLIPQKVAKASVSRDRSRSRNRTKKKKGTRSSSRSRSRGNSRRRRYSRSKSRSRNPRRRNRQRSRSDHKRSRTRSRSSRRRHSSLSSLSSSDGGHSTAVRGEQECAEDRGEREQETSGNLRGDTSDVGRPEDRAEDSAEDSAEDRAEDRAGREQETSSEMRGDTSGVGRTEQVEVEDGAGAGVKLTKKEATAKRIRAAVNAFHNGVYKSQRACAAAFGVSQSTLCCAIADPDYKYKGRGSVSTVMTQEEESKLITLITDRASVGMGFTIKQVTTSTFILFY